MNASDYCCRVVWLCVTSVPLTFSATSAYGAESESRAGHGHVSIAYQRIRVDGFEGLNGEVPIGTVDTHTLYLEVDYFLTDRWSIVAGLPLVRERYNGNGPHDPLLLNPPRPQVENIDDGSWNTTFQDVHLGAHYLAKEGTLQVEPFLQVAVPTHNYPHFGHAAIGQNRWRVEPGVALTLQPGLSDAWYKLDIAYVFVEKTLGVSINHWLARAEVGYFFSQRLRGRVFALYKNGSGLTSARADFPDRTTERWFQHDRMIKHNYTNTGIGLDWSLNERYQLSSSIMTMTRAEQVHKMEYAVTLALGWSF